MGQDICKACAAGLESAAAVGEKNGFSLLRCAECGSVTVSPFPSVEELTDFYQNYKGTVDYRKKADKKIKRAQNRIARLLKYTQGRRFLDVGSNYGFTVRAALNLGLDAKGIDIDDTAVKESRKNYGESLFETCSIGDYARRGEKADIIYTSEVIEHVPDPDAFVKALADTLEKGGVLYLTTPDAGHWRVPKKFDAWEQVMPPEHIVYFTRDGLTRLLRKHGLEVRKITFTLKPNLRVVARKI